MDATVSPPRGTGPFDWVAGLGIERAHYIALTAQDPAAAAGFAVAHMGLELVHVDAERRHYLAACGLDAYSVVYCQGPDRGLDHIGYAVGGVSALVLARQRLEAAGVRAERMERGGLWRQGPAVRFATPCGASIVLDTGVVVPWPMGHVTAAPTTVPGPISFDHAIVRSHDLAADYDFARAVMGLKESGRIVNPGGVPVLGFFRCRTLYHCFGIAHGPGELLHHFQLTLKDSHAVLAAYEKMKADRAVELLWGPLRHGAGQNVAFYFHDQAGHVVEYSAEEEIILDDDNYRALVWSTSDHRAADEWNRTVAPWSPARRA
jgi:catechol 2,3-dioxygenase-like lactoylglutathione lyase family enzyme